MLKLLSVQISRISAASKLNPSPRSRLKTASFLLPVISSLSLGACYQSTTQNNHSGTGGFAGAAGSAGSSGAAGSSTPVELDPPRYPTTPLCESSRESGLSSENPGLVLSNLRCTDEYQIGESISCFYTIENRGENPTEAFAAQLLLLHSEDVSNNIGYCEIPDIGAHLKKEVSCELATAPSLNSESTQDYYWRLDSSKLYQGVNSTDPNISVGERSEEGRTLISGGNCTASAKPDTDGDYEADCHFSVSNIGTIPTTAVIKILINQRQVASLYEETFDCAVPSIPVSEEAEVDCHLSYSAKANRPIRISAAARGEGSLATDYNWQQLLAAQEASGGKDVPILMDCSQTHFDQNPSFDCTIAIFNASQEVMPAELVTISAPIRDALDNTGIILEDFGDVNFECSLPQRAAGELLLSHCQGIPHPSNAYVRNMAFDITGGFDSYCIKPSLPGL